VKAPKWLLRTVLLVCAVALVMAANRCSGIVSETVVSKSTPTHETVVCEYQCSVIPMAVGDGQMVMLPIICNGTRLEKVEYRLVRVRYDTGETRGRADRVVIGQGKCRVQK